MMFFTIVGMITVAYLVLSLLLVYRTIKKNGFKNFKEEMYPLLFVRLVLTMPILWLDEALVAFLKKREQDKE
ncbi:hypothetical protein CQA49_00810 [Helicobacter sp. MIT 00-7814]|uniref:hypothetical protein n=1 Tax=unclassified Helicobacter TaxID=2593540 RepID=UPI000E1EB7F6|nr:MULTISPECIES: hypothetical protein [unclassified Helicobacter]RDU55054.1 hypothetical protein CQA37_04400 [Helicobacter sp. MIT 99-10781]RDU56873.1 hypothetical protein CQA49_00810 [Helicobacter sp. MIT 00-7814]